MRMRLTLLLQLWLECQMMPIASLTPLSHGWLQQMRQMLTQMLMPMQVMRLTIMMIERNYAA